VDRVGKGIRGGYEFLRRWRRARKAMKGSFEPVLRAEGSLPEGGKGGDGVYRRPRTLKEENGD